MGIAELRQRPRAVERGTCVHGQLRQEFAVEARQLGLPRSRRHHQGREMLALIDDLKVVPARARIA